LRRQTRGAGEDALKGWTTYDFSSQMGMARTDKIWPQGRHQVWRVVSHSGMWVDSNPRIAENRQKIK
jgi:hypothetical protein